MITTGVAMCDPATFAGAIEVVEELEPTMYANVTPAEFTQRPMTLPRLS